MKRLLTAVISLIAIGMMVSFSSCQGCTRQWGGTTKIELEPGEKLAEATWKNNIWYLVEPMESDYVPKTTRIGSLIRRRKMRTTMFFLRE